MHGQQNKKFVKFCCPEIWISVMSGHDIRFMCYQWAIFPLKHNEQNREKLEDWKDTLINLREMAELFSLL
jgi:hypothetical protein